MNIEAVHRGFLYQHLYGVGCILLARSQPSILEVATERDEDLEIVSQGGHSYVQVKTRSERLQLWEMSATLDRFLHIREEHKAGQRQGEPKFFIVCNQDAAGALKSDSRFVELQVRMISPLEPPDHGLSMPPAWDSVPSALEWCRVQAYLLPQTRLEAGTLVWKLATEMALASTGERIGGHSFATQKLDQLLELFCSRMQALPAPPLPYRSLEFEPDLEGGGRIRLIVGLSGAGKTAWIAQCSLHVSEQLIFFDVADNSDGTVASSLVREIAAVLAESGQAGDVRQALYPGATGIISLRAIQKLLSRTGVHPTIVIDNAHRISAHTMADVVTSVESARWILLAQPSPQLAELRARLGCEEEPLGGLTTQAIAAEFREHDSPLTITQAERVRALTAGLPLFVRDAALLCQRRFSRDCEALCSALEKNATAESSGQEVVLRGTIDHISPQAAKAAAGLSLSDVRLEHDETIRLLKDGLGISESEGWTCLKELTNWGIAQIFANRSVSIHDAFRTVLRGWVHLPRDDAKNSLRVLADIFRESISPGGPDRLLAYCRIAPHVRETATVVDLAGSLPEQLHEHGTADALRQIMADASVDMSLSDEDRFWAADTLTFWDFQRGASIETICGEMARLEDLFIPVVGVQRIRQAMAIKRLHVAGELRDVAAVRRIYAAAQPDCGTDRHARLILRYMYAVALLHCEELDAADLVTGTTTKGFLDFIGLSPQQLFGNNPLEIRNLLGLRANDIDDIKHVADAIDLRARVVAARGRPVALLKIWAFKLYALANAPMSAVAVGKDVVDELLLIGSVSDAQKFIEMTLIPGIAENGLVEELIPLQAQHAVVLAYAGRVNDARKELQDLSVFESSSELLARELAGQRQLVEDIAAGRQRLEVTRQRNLDMSGVHR
jgi:Cap4-like dsDNA endonuclease family protein/AAA domain-containing protein